MCQLLTITLRVSRFQVDLRKTGGLVSTLTLSGLVRLGSLNWFAVTSPTCVTPLGMLAVVHFGYGHMAPFGRPTTTI